MSGDRVQDMGRAHPSTPGMIALLGALICASAVFLVLLAVRVKLTGSGIYTFMRWNLILAWLPMLFALLLTIGVRRRVPSLVIALAGLLWLLFLPNAPYLVTDVVHLGSLWATAPIWFDLLMFGAFGLTGLLIGYGSLYLVHATVSSRFGPAAGWCTTFAALALTSVGIYFGRVFRLNSWDAFTRPELLAAIVHHRLSNPLGHPGLFPLLGGMVVLLAGGYALFYASTRAAREAIARHGSPGLFR